MSNIRNNPFRLLLTGFMALVLGLSSASTVFAASLSSASLTLSDPRTGVASDYTAAASGFTTATTINCIQLDIGTAVDGSGDAGLTVTGATLGANTIPSGGAWTVSVVDGATDQLRATSAGGATPNATGSITWQNVTNGATENVTYFGLLETYANVDCSTGGPIDTVALTFVYKNGELVTLTIDPSLTFACAPVATGQEVYPVGGASLLTTAASTPTGIDHASTVNPTTNGVSAHDLTTTTNASGGFNVYIRHTQLLTNGSSDTIATGGLASSAFPAPGTEAWAWTSDDGDLSLNGSGTGLWNSFTTTNAVIAQETGVASSTNRVGHQVGVSGTTPAGTYTTTIIYTAVATY